MDNRWLSIEPVIVRLAQQFGVPREFFIKGIFDSTTEDSTRFERICAQLKANKVTSLYLHFVMKQQISIDFSQCSKIQLLHDEMTEIVQCLLARFVKPDLIAGMSVQSLVSFCGDTVEN